MTPAMQAPSDVSSLTSATQVIENRVATATIPVQITPQTIVQQIAPSVPIGATVNVPTGTLVQPGTTVIGSVLYSQAQVDARSALIASDPTVLTRPAGTLTPDQRTILGVFL